MRVITQPVRDVRNADAVCSDTKQKRFCVVDVRPDPFESVGLKKHRRCQKRSSLVPIKEKLCRRESVEQCRCLQKRSNELLDAEVLATRSLNDSFDPAAIAYACSGATECLVDDDDSVVIEVVELRCAQARRRMSSVLRLAILLAAASAASRCTNFTEEPDDCSCAGVGRVERESRVDCDLESSRPVMRTRVTHPPSNPITKADRSRDH